MQKKVRAEIRRIIDINIIKKYIAQRKWCKLCIIFKLCPELLQFHNTGFYLVHYTLKYDTYKDFKVFKEYMSEFFNTIVSNIEGWLYEYKGNEIYIRYSQHDDNYGISIKKRTLNYSLETSIKKAVLESGGRLYILSELRI